MYDTKRCFNKENSVNMHVSKMIESRSTQSENVCHIKPATSLDANKDNEKQISSLPTSQKRKLPISLSQQQIRSQDKDTTKANLNNVTNQLNTAMIKCSLKEKTPSNASTSSYSVMAFRRRQQKQVYTTENIFSTCPKCHRSKVEESEAMLSTNNSTSSRRTQRRSWPLYSHSTSKKMSPPISPSKFGARQSRSRSPSKKPKLKPRETSFKRPAPNMSIDNLPSTRIKTSLSKSLKRNTRPKNPGDNISTNPFPPIPLTWRRSDRSIWDDSAAQLLDMTTNFLKQIPKVSFIPRPFFLGGCLIRPIKFKMIKFLITSFIECERRSNQ